MKYRKLGKAGLEVPVILMGCWSLGGGFTWGDQDEKVSIDTIKAAIDLGINFFDTAEFYSDGYSEEVTGRGIAGQRDKVLIATKVWPDHLSREGVLQACERSLRRLNTDYIDLYQIHWPSREIPVDETLGAMETLQKDGKIRFIGVSNFGVQDLSEAAEISDIVTDQLAYSLLFRAIEYEILAACRELQIGALAYSPLAQGLLTGKFKRPEDVDDERARIRFYTKNRPGTVHAEDGYEKEVFAAVDKIRMICDEIEQPMANVAIAWVLQQPGVSAVLVGARTPEQIQKNAEAASLELSQDVLGRLNKVTDELKQKMGSNADPWRTASRIR